MIRTIVGAGIIIVGIALALYCGIYLCFITGTIDVIDQVRAETIDSVILAWGIAKIVFSGLVIALCLYLSVLIGILVIAKDIDSDEY